MIRRFFLFSALFVLCLPLGAAKAQEILPGAEETIAGIPVVQNSGLIIVNGQDISLWGISALAPDQQCWQVETSWDCGQQATTALRHFLEGKRIECHVRHRPKNAPVIAQCFVTDEAGKKDVGDYLVRSGWAINDPALSGDLYEANETLAQNEKSGIWSSRFQTAQDWEDGIQRFVDEGAPDPAAANPNNGINESEILAFPEKEEPAFPLETPTTDEQGADDAAL